MFKTILGVVGAFALFGFLTPGIDGINLDKAAELNLPATYYFRSEPFQPNKLAGGCEGAACPVANWRGTFFGEDFNK